MEVPCGLRWGEAERTMRSEARLTVRRIRLDLKDFDLSRLPEIQGDVPWVAIGKHMCGASTDYALTACHKAQQSSLLLLNLYVD